MNKTIPNSQNFPQFMQAETVSEVKTVSKNEIADFRFNPAIQNRPIEILNIEKEENGVVLTLGTMARRAMLRILTRLHFICTSLPTLPLIKSTYISDFGQTKFSE